MQHDPRDRSDCTEAPCSIQYHSIHCSWAINAPQLAAIEFRSVSIMLERDPMDYYHSTWHTPSCDRIGFGRGFGVERHLTFPGSGV